MWTFCFCFFETGSSGWLCTHSLAKDAPGPLISLLLAPKYWDFGRGSLPSLSANRWALQYPVYVVLG